MNVAVVILSFALLFCEAAMAKNFIPADSAASKTKNVIDVQGHRGARGVLPENSIPAFIYAVQNGANTIEMDIVVSKDRKLVVSHDPWISPKICSHPDGKPVTEEEKDKLIIYEMDYREVRGFDCGSRGNDRFPDQKAMPTCKPLLSEVFEAVEKYIRENDLPAIQYNIEIKSKKKGDNKSNPPPADFTKMLYDEITNRKVKNKVIIQSFDVRPLQEMHKLDSSVKLALLVANAKGVSGNLKKLTFTPEVYSPYYRLVKKRTVKNCHEKGMKIIPWTVNDPGDIARLLDFGVDGIITDFPKRAQELISGR